LLCCQLRRLLQQRSTTANTTMFRTTFVPGSRAVRSPRGVPCCDVADGHRTDYQMRGDNHFWVPIDGEWRQVPTEAVVHNAGNPTGEGVVWYVHQGRTTDYFIRCFVPGDDA